PARPRIASSVRRDARTAAGDGRPRPTTRAPTSATIGIASVPAVETRWASDGLAFAIALPTATMLETPSETSYQNECRSTPTSTHSAGALAEAPRVTARRGRTPPSARTNGIARQTSRYAGACTAYQALRRRRLSPWSG